MEKKNQPLAPAQQIISKENSPEGYRTTVVGYTCPECSHTWQKTFRGVWSGEGSTRQLLNEKEVAQHGQPCGHCMTPDQKAPETVEAAMAAAEAEGGENGSL